MSATAITYLRVSGQGQVGGDGFPRQRKAVQEYAKANDLEILEEFRDEGVSGTKMLTERPGLSALLNRILGNGVRTILVEKMERLARDLIEGELILRELRRHDVQVIEVEGGTDLTISGDDNPTAKLIRQVLGAVAEFEKSALVIKLRVARQRKKARGERCEGALPFGERDGEQDTLKRILELRRKPKGKPRLSYRAIAKILNDEGRATRRGGRWVGESVRVIVQRVSPALMK